MRSVECALLKTRNRLEVSYCGKVTSVLKRRHRFSHQGYLVFCGLVKTGKQVSLLQSETEVSEGLEMTWTWSHPAWSGQCLRLRSLCPVIGISTLLRSALLLFVVLLSLAERGKVGQTAAGHAAPVAAVMPEVHEHVAATQNCHATSNCVVLALWHETGPASPETGTRYRFARQDELSPPSHRLPVNLPPPRLPV